MVYDLQVVFDLGRVNLGGDKIESFQTFFSDQILLYLGMVYR